jgi:hypothetical protein
MGEEVKNPQVTTKMWVHRRTGLRNDNFEMSELLRGHGEPL